LRDHRARAKWDNWMKDLRTELYQILYEKPIYPKNLYLKRAPMKHAEYQEKVTQVSLFSAAQEPYPQLHQAPTGRCPIGRMLHLRSYANETFMMFETLFRLEIGHKCCLISSLSGS